MSSSCSACAWEVIGAASTKPFGFHPFYPGPGLGGHCIPIDPFYLSWKAKEYDFRTPHHVVGYTAEALIKPQDRVELTGGSRLRD